MLHALPYIGGKRFLLKFLLPLIPPHKVYCEPFGGAGHLLLNKPRSELEVWNDADGDLANLFTVVRDQPEEFQHRCKLLLYSRQLHYEWQKQIDVGEGPADRVERAVRFYYVLRSSFAGKWRGGWAFERKARFGKNARSLLNSISEIQTIHERLKYVYIEHVDFRKCFKTWDTASTFFYVDPPYFNLDRYYYRFPFSEQDHRDLAEVLKRTAGQWLLTYNDHPLIRSLYAGFTIRRKLVSLASKKVARFAKRPRFANLLIMSYNPRRGPTNGRDKGRLGR